MQKYWIWIIVIVLIILAGGYFGRHQIKSMLGMTPSAPTTQVATPTPAATSSPTTSDIIMTKTDPKKGDYLTDAKGMTLYIFDKDKTGVSNCSSSCATTWPPFIVGATTPSTMPANITTIKRSDGTMQYAYKGMPLYYYAKDTKVGDILGDGIGGIWHLVKP